MMVELVVRKLLLVLLLLVLNCCTTSTLTTTTTRRMDENNVNVTFSPVMQPSSLPTSVPTVLSTTAAPTSSMSTTDSNSPPSSTTSIPSSTPSTSPTIGNSAPSFSLDASPTLSPSVHTNDTATDFPSMTPTVLPTSTPSLAPATASPTSSSTVSHSLQPSSSPTTSSKTPSTSPSSSPSSAPSTLPSAIPSLSPTTRRPTTTCPTNTPSSLPTSEPSSVPSNTPSASPSSSPTTEQPSSSPSTSPTTCPSSSPTSVPTSSPSASPTSIPTVRPSFMPTPQGIAGDDWWFLITCKVDLVGYSDWRDFTGERDQVTEGLNYAFSFVLTDTLGAGDRDKVTVIAKLEGKREEVIPGYVGQRTMKRLFNRYLGIRVVSPSPANVRRKAEEGNQTTLIVEYSMKAWCPSRLLASHVVSSMRSLTGNPDQILEPLRERELRSIQSLFVYRVDMTATTAPPDAYDPNLSPVRIFYIILGTVAFFILAVFIMKNAQYVYKRRDSISREFRYHIVPLCQECGQGIYAVCANMYGEIKAWLTPSLRRTYRSAIQEYDELDFQRSIHFKERKYDYLDDEERSMMDRSPGSSSHGGDSRENSLHGNTFKNILHSTIVNNVYSPIGKTLSLGQAEELDDEAEIELTSSALHRISDDRLDEDDD